MRRFFKRLVSSILGEGIREEVRRFLVEEHLIFGDAARVSIANTAIVNNALLNVVSGTIVIEEFAFFGHGVSLLTGTHDYRLVDRLRQETSPRSGRDIVIRRGAWVGSNATVLGPCVVGAHAVIAAGAVVVGDVQPGTIVAGVPARMVKVIDFETCGTAVPANR